MLDLAQLVLFPWGSKGASQNCPLSCSLLGKKEATPPPTGKCFFPLCFQMSQPRLGFCGRQGGCWEGSSKVRVLQSWKQICSFSLLTGGTSSDGCGACVQLDCVGHGGHAKNDKLQHFSAVFPLPLLQNTCKGFQDEDAKDSLQGGKVSKDFF